MSTAANTLYVVLRWSGHGRGPHSQWRKVHLGADRWEAERVFGKIAKDMRQGAVWLRCLKGPRLGKREWAPRSRPPFDSMWL